MANKSFDFGKLKRSFYPTKLKDGKTLVVEMPKKRTFEKMQIINDIDTDEAKSGEVYDEMLGLLAEILSNNRGKEVITAEYLEQEEYDIEEIIAYINDYADFVNTALRITQTKAAALPKRADRGGRVYIHSRNTSREASYRLLKYKHIRRARNANRPILILYARKLYIYA